MDPILATVAILVVAILAFASNKFPLGVVSIGVAVSLYLTGVLDVGAALAGFGDPTVIFIASLFVMSEALDATGITAWAGKVVISRAGTKEMSLLVVLSLLAAAVAAIITPNGAAAALVPLVVVVAARAKVRTSLLMMPLAFASHAGSMLLLTGTPVTMIVSEYAAEHGGHHIRFFEPALVGLPLIVGTLIILVIFGRRLLPNREGTAIPNDLVAHALTLRQDYALGDGGDLTVNAQTGITEVVIAPRSGLIGTRLSVGMATPSGDLVVLAAKRGEEQLKDAAFELRAGDILLLQGTWEDLALHTKSDDVLVVDQPSTLRRGVPLGKGAKRTLVLLGVLVVLLATGLVPPAIAALSCAALLVLMRVLTPVQAYRAISWTTVVLIGGMIPLSSAVLETGAAQMMAEWMLETLGDAGPSVALFAIVLLTVFLGQFISNTATVLIVAPIAVATAVALDASIMPFMLGLAVAGAASFFTPIATPANLMVMAPGGYRFGDYWKLGSLFAALFIAVAVWWVPVVWPF